MSRFYANVRSGTHGAKPVHRQGHAQRGIRAAVFGAHRGIEVYAKVDDTGTEYFYVYRIDPSPGSSYGPDMLHSRYAIGRLSCYGWETAEAVDVDGGIDIHYVTRSRTIA